MIMITTLLIIAAGWYETEMPNDWLLVLAVLIIVIFGWCFLDEALKWRWIGSRLTRTAYRNATCGRRRKS